ncbi:MAG: hypothetical protein E6I32_15505 [Chloroflexi bacterium]|nr:MAG: hypothetical protein E6I32_15505 [Chloroflexota bacterium]
MKRTFLAKLQISARYSLIGALLLVLGVPLYQLFVLIPSGYGDALTTLNSTLHWINTHSFLFLGYRALLIIAFALMLGLPFALFRIIVAQEILGREEDEEAGGDEGEEIDEQGENIEHGEDAPAQEKEEDGDQADGMPSFAWRGKGYAVIAAWTGWLGLIFFAGGTLASTIYLLSSASSISPQGALTDNLAPLTGFFAILTFTVGGGLLALSCLFFATMWVTFGYLALTIAALMSGSAVEVAFAPTTGQAILSTPAILLFALWVLWFAVMVVRLKPE